MKQIQSFDSSDTSHVQELWLYGAGEGARIYIQKKSDDVSITGIVDRDSNKWGHSVENIEIFSPRVLTESGKSYKVIVTTQWAEEVISELESMKTYVNMEIVVPDRRLITRSVFENKFVENEVFLWINLLSQKILEKEYTLWADMGTLLGLFRSGELIPWDNDVDLASTPEDLSKVLDLALSTEIYCKSRNWCLIPQSEINNGQSIVQHNLLLSLEDFKVQIPVSFYSRRNLGEYSHWEAFPGMWLAPTKHFNGTLRVETTRGIFLSPLEPSEYLRFHYGDDWANPKPSFSYNDYKSNSIRGGN